MQHGRAASGLQPDQGNDELGHQTRQQDSSSLGNEPGRSHNPYENCSRSDQEAYPPYSAAKSSTALHTASPSLAQSNHSPWDASDYPAEPIDSPGLHSSGYEARTYLQSQNPASYGAQSAWSHGTAQDEAEVRREPYETIRSAKMTSEQYSGLPSASSREASPYSSERKPACRSSASQIPLTEAAYPPTCFEASKSSKGEPTADETDYLDTLPKGDRPRKRRRVRFGDIFGRGSSGSDGSERKIYCNDPERNAQQRYKNNSVSTTKYNLATFLPKFLGEQFSKYANVFFLFTACVQQIPNVSPTNRFTTIVPLFIVLLVAAFKELQEDLKRHASDRALNGRQVNVLQDRAFVARQWRDLRVGDIVRLVSDDSFPADLLLLSSSEPDGLCYIETSNLDGETNLKIKQASPETAHLMSPEAIAGLDGYLRSEQPNNSLYTYEGTLAVPRKSGAFREVPMSPQQILLRGAQLRNTAWMYGLVVFTGHETKLMRNATATPVKRTAVERMVNVQILFLFLILLLLGFGSAFGAYIREHVYGDQMWYLLLGSETASSRTMTFVEDILTFIILYNNLIPISLIVTMEVVKFQQAVLINADLDMYYDKTKTAALCRTSSLVEELGQIEYVFSDKTGTLTCNEMQFRQCSIAGKRYADHVDESTGADVFSFTDLKRHAVAPDLADVIKEFLTLLATCHTVIPEQKASKIVYQASSPDEAALVSGAEMLDYRFTTRKPHAVIIDVDGRSEEHLVLNVCEFNSTRKRMSTILRGPDGRIKLYCKGADTVILERMSGQQSYTTDTLSHLQQYATEGLRTLCIAMREIPEDEYRQWSQVYDRAAATINGRSEALDQAAELIEKDLTLLGATAIEDRLQDGVPDTIHTLQQAGIKVWVLTGDRQETAINIGLSCRLISDAMELVIINEDDALATKAFIDKRLAMLDGKVDVPPLALIIDGKSLAFALEKPLSKDFLRLAVKCKAVVCCRVSPLQKALVVKLVKKNEKAILLAIGDGANDIGMIQAAHLGVGISGVEGLQAARSADVAISQFRYLKKLLLVHGAWSYRRLSLLILYSFYKNAVISAISFWFSFNSSFSGQVLYESWTLTMYNIFFTVLPPLALGVFDQFVNARMLDRYPELYLLGQRNAFFTKRIFWCWFLDAIYHSIIIFVCAAGVFWDDLVLTDGLDAGQWLFGTTVYMCVLLTVLLKAALVANTWTKYTVMAIPGSFLFAAVFLPAFQALAPIIGFATEYHGIVPRLWASPVFYFCLALLPVACLLRDLGWKSYKRLFNPQPYHIVQEIQALNLPDYRPRMAQFQRAIKKVRAVQHLRQNNGYAFSQTEGGQADLMKLYDTTIPRQQG
ncbi:hypothetical protein E5Q_01707 [Mixia osmundae IAM 14324]|uniref:Phospholipid-transporting ATPase n=1 Tax=Mixia osmundae (strain CBS 9802 / IAM 14324 / JCM 22182 / KY 12970) TaxID=764103 RepID=G7DWV5_MIXOS|nr:hypothetical protein E5Q_01707 [Mixia osmundae IAM 14324]